MRLRPREEGVLSLLSPFWAVFFLILLVVAPLPSLGKAVPSPYTHVKHGSFLVTRNNQTILEYNSDKLFVPASIIKLVTGLAAVKILGPDYRFNTDFYIDPSNNLLIRGGGDPYLVSEAVAEIGSKLKQQGILRINSIILDDSLFSLSGPADGISASQNPYDAENGALSVNFNSLPILIHKNGTVQSPEPQTPLIPLMREAAKNLPAGLHRINISSLPNTATGKKKLSMVLRYTGELFRAVLKQEGIAVKGIIQRGRLTDSCRHLLTFQSRKNVIELVQATLKYSNNFIANQLFLTCGIKKNNTPATWNKAQEVMADFLGSELHLDPTTVTIVEGSGISRKNKITAQAMINVLNRFKPYSHLLVQKKSTALKTGTLSNVFSYAGYFKNSGQLDPFVILLNQKKNSRDKLLRLLQHSHQSQKGR